MKNLFALGLSMWCFSAYAKNLDRKDEQTHNLDGEIAAVTETELNSPKENIRKQLFGAQLNKSSCQMVQIHPRGGIESLDKDLDVFLKTLISAIQMRKETDLQPLFHKRLNVPISAITETFSRVDSLLMAPIEVSIYRLWALNTVDGSPKGLDCTSDGLTLYPQYGYPLQFGIWLQLLGKNELGRIYVAVVPSDGRWNIGAFHFQQWTHQARDGLAWFDEGKKSDAKGLKESAFVKFDIAQKLLDAGGFLEIAMRDQVTSERDRLMTKADWQQIVKKTLPDIDVIYASSLLVLDGAGILTRVRVPGELSMVDIKQRCQQIAKKISQTPWGADLAGMRCSFNLPTEDVKIDGAMGGIYISFADLK